MQHRLTWVLGTSPETVQLGSQELLLGPGMNELMCPSVLKRHTKISGFWGTWKFCYQQVLERIWLAACQGHQGNEKGISPILTQERTQIKDHKAL